MKSNYFRENLAISWNIYQWFRSNATWNDNFDILKNHREERITIHIEIIATQKDRNLPVEEATFSILFGNNKTRILSLFFDDDRTDSEKGSRL